MLRMRKEEAARSSPGSLMGLEEKQLPQFLGENTSSSPSTEVVTSLLLQHSHLFHQLSTRVLEHELTCLVAVTLLQETLELKNLKTSFTFEA